MQIGQLMTSFGFSIMVITSLANSTPLLNLMPHGCDVFFFLIVTHNNALVCGGFMMALFRLICIKFSQYVYISSAEMVDLHLWVQHGLIAVNVAGYYIADQYYGSSNLHEFCRGYTTKVCSTLTKLNCLLR